MGAWFSRLFSDNFQPENPTLEEIKAYQNTKRVQREAEAARDTAEQIKQDAEKERERARACEEEANRTAVHAKEEMERMKVQMMEAANAAKRAEELAAAAAQTAQEDAAKCAREVQEERERAQKMCEDAEKAMAVAKEEAERTQQAANEQRRQAEAGKALAEEMAHRAAEEAQRANKAREDAERRWKEGTRPVVMPSPEEVATVKRRIQYREGCFHFAITGVSGSGKSSLVNAFRGLRNREAGAAAVGVTETTLQTTRYEDTNPDYPFVWYDIPGAGTLKCRDWQYFNDQGLYVFDCIIVLLDNRFTMTDIAILSSARRFNIPTYIVRSKADQHIQNIMTDMGDDSDGDVEGVKHGEKPYGEARKEFIEETRKSVEENLKEANIPDQRVYIVSSDQLWRIARSKMPKKAIDEVNLISDLASEAYMRRKVKHALSEGAPSMGSRVSSLVLAGLTQGLTSVGLIDDILDEHPCI